MNHVLLLNVTRRKTRPMKPHFLTPICSYLQCSKSHSIPSMLQRWTIHPFSSPGIKALSWIQISKTIIPSNNVKAVSQGTCSRTASWGFHWCDVVPSTLPWIKPLSCVQPRQVVAPDSIDRTYRKEVKILSVLTSKIPSFQL